MHRASSDLLRALRRPRCTQAVFARTASASTSANPYPFPTTSHPTPHQIFHLPHNATKADVKSRYYDLVRIYHPDSPAARAGGVSPETAHARFQAISSAYAVLSGKKPAASGSGSGDGADAEGFAAATRSSYHDLSTAMWRARQRRRAELDVGMDERWKERLMLGAVLLAVALFVFQNYTTRTRAMAEARHRSYGRTSSSRSDPPLSSGGTDESKLALDPSQSPQSS